MKIPTPADVIRHSAQQLEALAQLPESILIFNRSLNTFAQTVGRLDTLVRRMDTMTAPLEAPIRALAPRLEAMVPVIEQYSVEEMADLLQRSVMPALQMMGDTQAQIRSIATSVEQLIRVVEELFGRLQEIPGLSLMSRLVPAAPSGGSGKTAGTREAKSPRHTSGPEEVRR